MCHPRNYAEPYSWILRRNFRIEIAQHVFLSTNPHLAAQKITNWRKTKILFRF